MSGVRPRVKHTFPHAVKLKQTLEKLYSDSWKHNTFLQQVTFVKKNEKNYKDTTFKKKFCCCSFVIMAIYLVVFLLLKEHAGTCRCGLPTQVFVATVLVDTGGSRHWILLNPVSLFVGG